MEGTTVAAILSFLGFIASIALYTLLPLAKGGLSWQTPGTWLSAILLVAGLACFVVFLVTGLITFFNRGSSLPPRERRQE